MFLNVRKEFLKWDKKYINMMDSEWGVRLKYARKHSLNPETRKPYTRKEMANLLFGNYNPADGEQIGMETYKKWENGITKKPNDQVYIKKLEEIFSVPHGFLDPSASNPNTGEGIDGHLLTVINSVCDGLGVHIVDKKGNETTISFDKVFSIDSFALGNVTCKYKINKKMQHGEIKGFTVNEQFYTFWDFFALTGEIYNFIRGKFGTNQTYEIPGADILRLESHMQSDKANDEKDLYTVHKMIADAHKKTALYSRFPRE